MGIETGRFRRSDRLLDSRDFRRVLRSGRRRANRDLVIFSAPLDRKHRKSNMLEDSRAVGSRLGITASRKVGGAVVRNRLKRRIRAWFRENRRELACEQDLVVIARRSGASLSFEELDRKLRPLLDLERPQEPAH